MTSQRITHLQAEKQKARARARSIEDRIKAEQAKLRDMMVTVCEQDHPDWFNVLERDAVARLEKERLDRAARAKAARDAKQLKQPEETSPQGGVATPVHADETEPSSYTGSEGSVMSSWSNQ